MTDSPWTFKTTQRMGPESFEERFESLEMNVSDHERKIGELQEESKK